jgi:hypothetical protein
MAVTLRSRKCQLSRERLPEAMELILCAFENLQNGTVSLVLSVCPSVILHGTNGLPLDGFSRNFGLVGLTKICQEKSCLVKIGL